MKISNEFIFAVDERNNIQNSITRSMYKKMEYIGYNYIKMRIVPPTRHAINQILNELGLEEYNQVKLLDHTKGRCVMDFSYFREIPYDGIEPQYGESGVKGGIVRGPINKLEKGI